MTPAQLTTYADEVAAAVRCARTQPVRWYRVRHTVFGCEMGSGPTRASVAALYWEACQAGLPVELVEDWLDLRGIAP